MELKLKAYGSTPGELIHQLEAIIKRLENGETIGCDQTDDTSYKFAVKDSLPMPLNLSVKIGGFSIQDILRCYGSVTSYLNFGYTSHHTEGKTYHWDFEICGLEVAYFTIEGEETGRRYPTFYEAYEECAGWPIVGYSWDNKEIARVSDEVKSLAE